MRHAKTFQRGSTAPGGDLDGTAQGSDPIDPTPRNPPVARLGEATAAPRAKSARRDRPVRKATKRATSRRR